MKLVVELPFDMVPIGVDGELEAARVELVRAYERLRAAVLRAYEVGYTVSRISELAGLSLDMVVEVVRGRGE